MPEGFSTMYRDIMNEFSFIINIMRLSGDVKPEKSGYSLIIAGGG
jgi:hypothetical protein